MVAGSLLCRIPSDDHFLQTPETLRVVCGGIYLYFAVYAMCRSDDANLKKLLHAVFSYIKSRICPFQYHGMAENFRPLRDASVNPLGTVWGICCFQSRI